jgi:hypothetical protein
MEVCNRRPMQTRDETPQGTISRALGAGCQPTPGKTLFRPRSPARFLCVCNSPLRQLYLLRLRHESSSEFDRAAGL